jgi:RNA polymerase sigma-70 factor (ECF subfamily)
VQAAPNGPRLSPNPRDGQGGGPGAASARLDVGAETVILRGTCTAEHFRSRGAFPFGQRQRFAVCGEAGVAQDPLIEELIRGENGAWEAFVRRYAGLVVAAVRGIAREPGEIEDLTQEVFLRLCKNDFRLLKSYDPARAGLSTWITIVARSTARDAMRRHRPAAVPIEAVPEAALAIDPVEPVRKLKLPEALLSPRQREILAMLYDRDMEVAEIAAKLGIDPQTVRSAHHKAMLKLRAHFKSEPK